MSATLVVESGVEELPPSGDEAEETGSAGKDAELLLVREPALRLDWSKILVTSKRVCPPNSDSSSSSQTGLVLLEAGTAGLCPFLY